MRSEKQVMTTIMTLFDRELAQARKSLVIACLVRMVARLPHPSLVEPTTLEPMQWGLNPSPDTSGILAPRLIPTLMLLLSDQLKFKTL